MVTLLAPLPSTARFAFLLLAHLALHSRRSAVTAARVRHIPIALAWSSATLLLLATSRLGEHHRILGFFLVLLSLGQHLLLGARSLLLQSHTFQFLVPLECGPIVLLLLAHLAFLQVDLAGGDHVMLRLGEQIGALTSLNGGQRDIEAGFVAMHREVGKVSA